MTSSTRPRVLICANQAVRDEIISGEGVARLEQIADWEWLQSEGICNRPGVWGGPSEDPAEIERLRAKLQGVDILLVCHGSPLVDGAMLDAAPRLKLIGGARGRPLRQPHRRRGGS